MNKCLIINHQNFSNVGGIEKYLYLYAKFCITNGIRVIWLCHKTPLVASSFKDLFLGEKIERVYVKSRGFSWFSYDSINLSHDESYLIFNCSPLAMCISEDIMRRYPDNCFFPVYALPNTTGDAYFLERNFHLKPVKKWAFNQMKKMTERWDSYHSQLFFNAKQAEALSQNYNITIASVPDKKLSAALPLEPFDAELLENRAKCRNEFKIVTAGRFDFPHKGYMLGLIQAYGELKSKYPFLRLQIIGYGPCEKQVLSEISKLPETARKGIELTGEVSPDRLTDYYKVASLNIGVAGSVSMGARVALLSLMARNFCSEGCEVYGFYSKDPSLTVSCEPGLPVVPFIERVIRMSDEEYIQASIDCYRQFEKNFMFRPLYLFELAEQSNFIFSNEEIAVMKLIKRMITVNRHIKVF